MGFHPIDWAVVLVPAVLVLLLTLKTRRYVRGVSDFLAAGRCAGRYLVCNAVGEAAMGAVSVVALFEMMYRAGFVVGWWQTLATPVAIVMTLSGFVAYRYRETRAMTLAEFFERRYSRRFRVFAGTLCAASGILNYAIFPAVGARFFVYYCGMPDALHVGNTVVPTFAVVMAVLLAASLAFTLMGGQLTAMVADCVEGLISMVLYLVVAVALLWLFGWSRIGETLARVPEHHSMLNPFDSGQVRDFNLWYVLIAIAASVYTRMAWQGNQGFNCAAASAHEAKMGGVLGRWREFAKMVMIVLLAVSAYTYLNNPAYAAGAARVNEALAGIENPFLRRQMQVPVALGDLLPIGIKGAFAAVMLFALLACDSSYLHSWGSIVVQDVILPLRRTAPDPARHLRMLRISIAGVALFAFVFSLLFKPTDFILMYFALSGAVFTGGAGAAIIGGLYWKQGTTAAAWVGMIIGSALAVSGILLQQLWPAQIAPRLVAAFPASQWLRQHTGQFPLNGQWMLLISMASAVGAYVSVSLLTSRRPFDMERLLHRGRWAVDEAGRPRPEVSLPPRTWRDLLGFDAHYTRADRFQSSLLFVWSLFWFAVFVVVTTWNLLRSWPDAWWSKYWLVVGVAMPLVVGVVTAVWFTIGGVRDLRRLFRHLATASPQADDNGEVRPIVDPNDTNPTAATKPQHAPDDAASEGRVLAGV